MQCVVRKEGLQYVFDVDGKIIYPNAYMSYCPEKENIDAFKKKGIQVFMFPIYVGDEGINMESGLRPFTDNFFKGYGNYDFTAVDRVLEMIAPTGMEEVYVIPRVCIEPPKWWQKLYPGEVARDFRGETLRECFASEKWREDMAEALKALIDHIEASRWKKRVIGYHIAAGGTEEWTYQCRYREQYYDYAEPNLRAYRKFLQEKYHTVEALSAAWNRILTDWDAVVFPDPVERCYAWEGFLRKTDTEQHVLDYFDFHNEIVADTILYFCKVVKEYTAYSRITGAFYGYVFLIPMNFKGLHATRKLVSSPYIDFLSTTNNSQQLGKAWDFSSTVHSALLGGKMWIAEGDIRTCLSTGLAEKLPHATPDNDYYSSDVWKGPVTVEGSCSMLKIALARILTAPCGIWWFDMFGGWFQNLEMMSIIGNAGKLLKQQSNDYMKTEIALIVDERGHKYSGVQGKRVQMGMIELSQNLSHMGATFHNYLLSDLTRDEFPVDEYKLYIFVAAVNPTKEESAAINAKLKGKGKTLLWLHTSSVYHPELCEFTLDCCEETLVEKAEFEGAIYPEYDLPMCKFHEEKGYILSRFTESGAPAVIWKRRNDYNTVYSLPIAPPKELLRRVALLAGVHLYNLSGDCIFAGGKFIAIHAVESGYRRINLPERGYRAENALTGERLTVNDMFIDLKMKQYDTVIVHLEKE